MTGLDPARKSKRELIEEVGWQQEKLRAQDLANAELRTDLLGAQAEVEGASSRISALELEISSLRDELATTKAMTQVLIDQERSNAKIEFDAHRAQWVLAAQVERQQAEALRAELEQVRAQADVVDIAAMQRHIDLIEKAAAPDDLLDEACRAFYQEWDDEVDPEDADVCRRDMRPAVAVVAARVRVEARREALIEAAETAQAWPFGKDDMYWQTHQKSGFVRWLRGLAVGDLTETGIQPDIRQEAAEATSEGAKS